MSVGQRLRDAFARDDFEEMIAVLHPDGAPEEQLHQVETVHDDSVLAIRDCPDRESAFKEAGLS